MRFVIFATILMSAPVLAAPDAASFNLECSGISKSKDLIGDSESPYSVTYRIDLGQKKWCEGECRALHDIAEIQPSFILLVSRTEDTPSRNMISNNTIDRTSGKQSATYISKTYGRYGNMMMQTQDGQCERQPFTGFPKFDTKF